MLPSPDSSARAALRLNPARPFPNPFRHATLRRRSGRPAWVGGPSRQLAIAHDLPEALGCAAVSDKSHDVILKILAVLIGLKGFLFMVGGLGDAGVFYTLFQLALGAFGIGVAVSFWKYRGWAFLVVSVWLLLSFMVYWIRLLIAFDRGTGIGQNAAAFVVVIALIGYLGRYRMERRFRPHLDAH
jgi:hypothetical protein